jgi:iron(III) transport system permease protein
VAAILGWMFLLSPNVGYLNVWLRRTPLFDHLSEGPIDIYSRLWIVLLTGFTMTSFVYLFCQSSLRAMGGNYQVAASVCGASELRVLLTVTVPLLRPAIVYSTGIVLLLSLGQFNAPLILGRAEGVTVLTTAMQQTTREFPVDYALGAGFGTPLVAIGLVVVLLQRLSVHDSGRFVVARGRVEGLAVKSSWLAAGGLALYGLLAIVLPVLSLVYVSFSPFWSGHVDLGTLTTQHWQRSLDNGDLWEAVSLSLRTAGLAALIALPLGLVVAWALSGNARLGGRMRTLIDVVSMAPLAVPAALLGFGFLFVYTREPLVLYGTPAILVVVYVTLAIPHSTRMQLSALTSLGLETYEASRVCGAGLLRTFAQVIIPQIRGGVAGAAAITFVILSHEFSASLMVRSVQTRVLGTSLFEAYENGLYPQVAAIALVMVVVTMGGVLVALALGGAETMRRL